MTAIHYRTAKVDDRNVFYREVGASGDQNCCSCKASQPPATCSAISSLCSPTAFHIVAPDLPGFGNSDMPDKANTFDQIATTIDRFTGTVCFDRFALYVFDYGAPTGFRLAVKLPERITAIISQNGNAMRRG